MERKIEIPSMSKEEIARAKGVSWHTVHQSIQQGLRRMENILKNS